MDELSPEVLYHLSIALPPLEADALVAFLPARLVLSMESLGDDSIVLASTLYSLCPGDPDEGWRDNRIAEMVAPFNAAQRNVVGEFLHWVKFWCA